MPSPDYIEYAYFERERNGNVLRLQSVSRGMSTHAKYTNETSLPLDDEKVNHETANTIRRERSLPTNRHML